MKFSIITINYNNREGLRSTIDSVVRQTSDDYEFIVIDGGSTDGSVEVVNDYKDRINYWVSEPDKGIYHAMNKGVAQAHGDYCIFMNSGDSFYDPTVLERVKAANPSEDIVVGKVVIDDQNHLISPPPKGEFTMYHLYSGSIPHQGSFIRTELLRKYPYDEELKISSDWKFFVQALIFDNSTIRYIDDFVARYDTTGVGLSHPELMKSEKVRYLEEVLPPRVLKDYEMMKASECLTQSLTPSLRKNYRIDKFLYRIGKLLLKLR